MYIIDERTCLDQDQDLTCMCFLYCDAYTYKPGSNHLLSQEDAGLRDVKTLSYQYEACDWNLHFTNIHEDKMLWLYTLYNTRGGRFEGSARHQHKVKTSAGTYICRQKDQPPAKTNLFRCVVSHRWKNWSFSALEIVRRPAISDVLKNLCWTIWRISPGNAFKSQTWNGVVYWKARVRTI